MLKILGEKTDPQGRCKHYHQENDIVALKCNKCGAYYACYLCHDELTDHKFAPISINDPAPILCGNCKNTLSYDEYKKGCCPFCQHPFNPACHLHHDIYFKD